MSKRKFPKLYHRKWLNKDKGSAYVITSAEVEPGYNYTTNKDDETKRNVYAWLEVKDCNRQSRLEFDYHNHKEFKQRLTKVRQLIEELEALEEFMKNNPPVTGKESKAQETLELTEEMKVTEDKASDDNVVLVTAELKPAEFLKV